MSHLSKIEQGKAEGSPEVLRLLLQRLGVEWRDDPDFCLEASAWFEEWYDRLFSGENIESLSQPWPSVRRNFRTVPFSWTGSCSPGLPPAIPRKRKDYVSVMDDRQYNLYLCMTEQFQELLHVSNRSYFLLAAGTRPFVAGDYEKAAICFQRGMDQAYREGSLRILMKCCGNLGTCYSCLNQLEKTRECYAAASGWPEAWGV